MLNERRAGGWGKAAGRPWEASEKTLNAGLWVRGGSRRKDAEVQAGGAVKSQGANKKMNSDVVEWMAHCGSSRRGRQHK